jgi:hypothetical protein
MRAILTAACLIFISSSAFAAEFNVESSDYQRADYGGYYNSGSGKDTRWKIIQRDSKIRFIDKKQDLVYVLDLNKSGEQALTSKFIKNLRDGKKAGAIANIVEKVTVSNVRNGRTTKELLVDAHVYLRYNTVFGQATAKVTVECMINQEKESSFEYIDGTEKEVMHEALVVRLGTDARLSEFQTSLGSQSDRLLALITDLGLRLGSPMRRLKFVAIK